MYYVRNNDKDLEIPLGDFTILFKHDGLIKIENRKVVRKLSAASPHITVLKTKTRPGDWTTKLENLKI